MDKPRCGWAIKSEIETIYHDEIWGNPEHDERKLFEKLMLDGQQAGLSWRTILQKTESYRKAYDLFDPEKIVRYDDKKVEELMQNAGIIRNRLKVNAIIKNAGAYLKLCETDGGLDPFLWKYVEGKPILNRWKEEGQVPASTPLSDDISKELKKRGFSFVGTTIVYAFMQAIGLVNDHLTTCYKHPEYTEHKKI